MVCPTSSNPRCPQTIFCNFAFSNIPTRHPKHKPHDSLSAKVTVEFQTTSMRWRHRWTVRRSSTPPAWPGSPVAPVPTTPRLRGNAARLKMVLLVRYGRLYRSGIIGISGLAPVAMTAAENSKVCPPTSSLLALTNSPSP